MCTPRDAEGDEVMLATTRLDAIVKIVDDQKSVTVQDLAQRLGASESTIRRDLVQLDRMKRIIRVHGGATTVDTQYVLSDQSMTEKYEIYSNEKKHIGRYAATLISAEDFVYIDAGTTTECLVDFITEKNATYVTNSISHARKLLTKGCRVILPGGELKPNTEALVGPDTIESLLKYHFTIGFWGTNGVTDKDGFTTPEMNEAMVKKLSMQQTKTRYVLCDVSKFSKIAPVTFAHFDDAIVITNHIKDKHYKQYKNIVEADES